MAGLRSSADSTVTALRTLSIIIISVLLFISASLLCATLIHYGHRRLRGIHVCIRDTYKHFLIARACQNNISLASNEAYGISRKSGEFTT